MVNRVLLALFTALTLSSASALPGAQGNVGNAAYPLLRLKLVLDQFNSDDIAIAFNSSATTQYNSQLDSRYLKGIDALEGLFSLSSDNVPLSAYIVPLPKQNPLIIGLVVEAKNSGPFTLQRTELDSIPPLYDFWLMDKYTKDSVNLRTSTDYTFNINKNDTASFGRNRFEVVIRQNPALMAHLLSFSAVKAISGNQISWATENEQDTTSFIVERSIDDAATFFVLDSLLSNGSGAYTFTDKNPINGTDIYRLKMQDMNGTTTYSNVVSIGNNNAVAAETSNNITIYPNPSNGIINLAINPGGSKNPSPNAPVRQTNSIMQTFAIIPPPGDPAYTIKIINIKGSVVKTAISASANWQDNLSNLAPGTYILQVVNNADNSLAGKGTFIKL